MNNGLPGTLLQSVGMAQATLPELEGRIEAGLQTFVDVGNCLLAIRDRRLYKEKGYTRFEDYCREQWGWSRVHAHRQIEAAQTANILLPIGNTPQTESQARELTPLVKHDEQEAVAIWRQLKEEHGDTLTAKVIRQAVEDKLKEIEPESEELRQAIREKKMLEDRIAELESRPPAIKEVEKTVVPSDYSAMKAQLQSLQQQQESNQTAIKRLQEDKSLLERKVKLNEQEAHEYGQLKSQIENLKNEKTHISRQIESATQLAGLVVRVEDLLIKELAPIKYSRAIEEQRKDDVVVRNLTDIVRRVSAWCDEMEGMLLEQDYIEMEVVSYE